MLYSLYGAQLFYFEDRHLVQIPSIIQVYVHLNSTFYHIDEAVFYKNTNLMLVKCFDYLNEEH